MYEITDKPSAIRAVQRLLSENQSGIYDERTRDAVIKSQQGAGIEGDGTVDYPTFLYLLNEFKLDTVIAGAGDAEGVQRFPYTVGMGGADVSQLHLHLRRALDLYRYESIKPSGSYFNRSTELAVMFLRKVFRLRDGGDVDEVFYTRLKREILSL